MFNRTITLILFTLCICITTVAAVEHQLKNNVNLQGGSLLLNNVLKEITRQTGINFVFENALIDRQVIKCDFVNRPLREVLYEILSPLDISYKISSNNFITLFREKSVFEESYENTCTSSETKNPILVPPIEQYKIKPDYPYLAQINGYEGTVSMRLLINTKGAVEKVTMDESSNIALLDQTAVEYAYRLKFLPAQQESKPVKIWLSKKINFRLLDASFQPLQYAGTVKHLIEQAEQANPGQKNDYHKSILSAYDFYLMQQSKNPEINYNKYLQEFINPEIYNNWKTYWQDWPLRFVVFQDFILRFPDSDLYYTAQEKLVEYLKKDLQDIKVGQRSDLTDIKKVERFNTTAKRLIEKYSNPETSEVTFR